MLYDLTECPLKKSQLEYRCNFNYTRISKYFAFLRKLQLVAISKDDSSTLVITDEGRNYLSYYHKIVSEENKRKRIYDQV